MVYVPDSEGRASHAGPASCVPLGHGKYAALTGAGAGRVWSPESGQSWVPTRSAHAEGNSGYAVRARRRRTWRGRRPRAGAETLKIIPIEAYWASDATRHGAPNASAVMHDALGPVRMCSFIAITSIEEEDICIVLPW